MGVLGILCHLHPLPVAAPSQNPSRSLGSSFSGFKILFLSGVAAGLVLQWFCSKSPRTKTTIQAFGDILKDFPTGQDWILPRLPVWGPAWIYLSLISKRVHWDRYEPSRHGAVTGSGFGDRAFRRRGLQYQIVPSHLFIGEQAQIVNTYIYMSWFWAS